MRTLCQWLTSAALSIACLGGQAAHATLITFDEQPWHPDAYGDDSWSAYPITTEYDGLGVRFFNGYLEPGSGAGGQTLLGGPSFQVNFTDTLPLYVSLDFWMVSPLNESTVTGYGPGYAATFSSGGYNWGGPDIGLVYTPHHVHNHASFYSPNGIAGLDFSTFTQTRIIASIDNLYFGAVPPVPEPASLAMMAAGLGVIGLAWRRGRRRGRSSLGRAGGAATLALAAGAAQAAFIDFEDLPWNPGPEPSWASQPLSDEYASLGVRLDGGYLSQWYEGSSNTGQYLTGGPYFSINFTGPLPTQVALDLSSPYDSRALVSAYDMSGHLVGTGDTGGLFYGGPDRGLVTDRPYQANSFIALAAPQGISRLGFEVYSSSRITGLIDNLYFGNVAPVPEPAPVWMALAGLAVLGAAARRREGARAVMA